MRTRARSLSAAEEETRSLSRVFRAQTKAPRAVQVAKTHDPAEQADPAFVLQDAERRAGEALAAAREEAAALVQAATAEVATMREQLAESAYREGFEKGYQAGYQQAAEVIGQAEAVLAEARQAFDAMVKQSEPKMLGLALDTARRIASDALKSDPDVVLEMVRRGMSALRDEREFSLHVDPELVSIVEGERDDLGRQFGAKSLEVVADESAAGGAIVRTPHGFVDVTIESQIRNLSVALAEARKRAVGDVQ